MISKARLARIGQAVKYLKAHGAEEWHYACEGIEYTLKLGKPFVSGHEESFGVVSLATMIELVEEVKSLKLQLSERPSNG